MSYIQDIPKTCLAELRAQIVLLFNHTLELKTADFLVTVDNPNLTRETAIYTALIAWASSDRMILIL